VIKLFDLGNVALAEGALHAGCNFFAGYPITPSSEIMHYMAQNMKRNHGVFIQMEDEIGSIGACIGASWSGAKAMTATSGPGFSLMQENTRTFLPATSSGRRQASLNLCQFR